MNKNELNFKYKITIERLLLYLNYNKVKNQMNKNLME